MRVQNLTANATNIYDVTPSSIVFTISKDGGFNFEKIEERSKGAKRAKEKKKKFLNFSFASRRDVIMKPGKGQELGTEDPRIVYIARSKTYLMFYTSVTKGVVHSDLGPVRAMLSLATNDKDPSEYEEWKLQGYLFPSLNWSKSGALLVREESPSYLFWGDSSICIATTENFVNYTDTGSCLLSPRDEMFDSELVESGPEPLPLSDGNLLFLYNSARATNITNPKPGWNLQYNLGYAVLSGKDPTQVLYRSALPLLSPLLPWETCDGTDPLGLTPNVVFVEGWRPIPGERNRFFVWYQGCDSRIGVAEISVDI